MDDLVPAVEGDVMAVCSHVRMELSLQVRRCDDVCAHEWPLDLAGDGDCLTAFFGDALVVILERWPFFGSDLDLNWRVVF
mgnify:CR=1 FL=1